MSMKYHHFSLHAKHILETWSLPPQFGVIYSLPVASHNPVELETVVLPIPWLTNRRIRFEFV